MIALIHSTKNGRARDKSRALLVIGQGEGKRCFHLSETEVSQLKKAAAKYK